MMTSLAATPLVVEIIIAFAMVEAFVIASLVIAMLIARRERMAFVRSLDLPKIEQTSLFDDVHVPQEVLGAR